MSVHHGKQQRPDSARLAGCTILYEDDFKDRNHVCMQHRSGGRFGKLFINKHWMAPTTRPTYRRASGRSQSMNGAKNFVALVSYFVASLSQIVSCDAFQHSRRIRCTVQWTRARKQNQAIKNFAGLKSLLRCGTLDIKLVPDAVAPVSAMSWAPDTGSSTEVVPLLPFKLEKHLVAQRMKAGACGGQSG